MVLEEQDQKFSNSSSASGGGGGGSGCSRFVKKQKQNKFPQRGPGVAVLEKIRIEEQEKDAEFIDVTPNLHLSNQSSSSSIPFLYPSPIDYPLSMFKSIVPLPNPKGLPAISVTGHGNVTKLSNSYYCSLEMDSPYESNPTWPPFQKVMQKMQQYQQPSSMVNVPSETSSSSVQNFQMEPPSNQKYYSNYIPWPPEEERARSFQLNFHFRIQDKRKYKKNWSTQWRFSHTCTSWSFFKLSEFNIKVSPFNSSNIAKLRKA